MKRALLFFVIMVTTVCTYAQSRYGELSEIFQRRRVQRLAQFGTYIRLIGSGNYDSDTKKYYIKKASALFSDKAEAVLKYNGERYVASMDSFCNYLACNKITIKTIDSVYVPKARQSDFATDNDTIFLKAELIKFPQTKFAELKDSEPETLPVFAEETEDGIEWIPLFGNVIITCDSISSDVSVVMKTTDKKEEYEDIIDIIRNIFYHKR